MSRSLSFSAVFLLTCACSGDPTFGEGSASRDDSNAEGLEADPSSTAPAEQLLNRFSFEDLTLAFYWMGPGSSESQEGRIAIEETFHAADYLGGLRNQYGSVTSLEIFKAFAPDGLAPHPALLAQHEREARAFGRNDPHVLELEEYRASVDKSVPVNCNNQVLPDISPGVYSDQKTRDIAADGQLFYLCVGSPQKAGSVAQPSSNLGCALQDSDEELTVGICNDTASKNPTEFWTQVSNPLNRTTTKRANVAPGGIARFTLLPSVFPFIFDDFTGLGVIGRNSTANVVNAHRQRTGRGVYP